MTENDDVLSRSNLTSVASKARLDKDPLCKVSVLTFEDATRIKNYLGPAGLFGNMDKKRVEKGNGEIVHVDVWAAGLQLPSIADVDLGETSSEEEEEEEGGVAPGFNVDKALEAQVARLSSSSSSSSMPPEQLAIRADALTDFNVPEALNPGGLGGGGLARAVLAASPRVMLPRHSPLPAAAAAAPDGGGLMLLVRRTGL